MRRTQLVVWGRQTVLEALRAGVAREVLLEQAGRRQEQASIWSASAAAGVPVQTVPRGAIERLAAGQVHQSVVARVDMAVYTSAAELAAVGFGAAALLLALDKIQDPHNLGALLRSAEVAGADGVLVPARGSSGITGTVARASAGALHHVRLAEVPNLVMAMEELRGHGIWLVGLDGAGTDCLYDVDLRAPTCLVVGGEHAGLRRLTRERCDVVARLPVLGRVESLNASVAGGVALFEAVRQRLATGHSSTG